MMEESKEEDLGPYFAETKKLKAWKKVKSPRKIKSLKFRTFKGPRHMSRKVRDLKELKELRLVSSLSSGFKRLGNHKAASRLSQFTYKSNMRGTRLRPRFKQQKTSRRVRRASSASLLRADLDDFFPDPLIKARSNSLDMASNESDEEENENESSDETQSDEDKFEFAPLSTSAPPLTAVGSLGHKRRLLKTSSGSGVYFANGYFQLSVLITDALREFGRSLKHVPSKNDGGITSKVVIGTLSDDLKGKDGEDIPAGVLSVDDRVVMVDQIKMNEPNDFLQILATTNRNYVELGVQHYESTGEADLQEEEMSSSSEASEESHIMSSDNLIEKENSEVDSRSYGRCLKENQHLVLKILPDRVNALTKSGEDVSYSTIQEDVSKVLELALLGDNWRVWFTDQLDKLCESGLFTVLGMDMETMSPVLARIL